jgi:DNA-binding CsgD family transcriptional regulator
MPHRQARRREVEALQNQILSCASPDGVEACILEPLRQVFGASTGTLLAFRHDGDGDLTLPASWSRALPKAVHQAYHQSHYRDDPMVQTHLKPAVRQSGAERADVRSFEVSDLETVGRTPSRRYMEEFWSSNQLRHMAGLTIHPAPGSNYWVVLALHRYDGEQPFEATDVAALETLGGVARAVSHALTADLELKRAQAAVEALDRCLSPSGLALLGRDGEILHATRGARQHWTSHPTIRERVLAKANDHGCPTKSFTLDSSANRKLRFVAQRAGDGSDAIMILSGRALEDGHTAATCAEFGLTERETEVALAAIDGLSNEDISGLFGISKRTVENHLRAIFEKAGVESRTRLARLLLTPRS